jgi:glycosyltransferase involved in cell wall biosynthesis
MYHGNFAAYLVSRTFAPQSALVWNIRVGLDTMSTYRPFTRALIRFGANLSQAADRVIYNAISARDQHEAIGYCSERSQWIPNGFDLERFRPDPSARVEVRQELGLHQETPLLGHFARFHAEKNQRLFLSALEALAPDVHGLMAGQGIHAGEPELVEMIHQFGLENRVHLLGERTDLPRLTASLDIAVSPSWNEGFSNTLGEALACGVPCVATRVGDSETLVGMAGRIVPPGNIPAMVEALSLILALPLSQRANMGELGRQQMAVSYNLGAVAHQYQTLYETLAL